MTKRYLEDFEPGDKTESTVGRTMSEYDLYNYSGIEGSYSELHTNKEYIETSRWDDLLVHGVLNMAIMMGLAKRIPWEFEALGLYGFDNVRFIEPVFVGDTVYLKVEVVGTEDRDEDHGILTLKEDLYKGDDVLTVTRERKFLVQKRPKG